MKKIIISFFCFLPLFLLAQNDSKPVNFCGSDEGRSQWLIDYQNNPASYETRGDNTLYLPLTVHIVGNDDGKGFYSYNQFLDDLCSLNADYKQVNIRFYLASPVNYIKNTVWNNHANYQDGASMFTKNNVKNTINCYIVTSAAGNCGYDQSGKGMALAKGCMGKGNNTWAHEMGHELSLPHTFLGWEGQAYDPTNPTPTTMGGRPVELLDGSNCKTGGDGFCDTPPDYYSGRWNCGVGNKSNVDAFDPAGSKFKIRGDLFMSYADDACMSLFSPDQISAMRAHSLSTKKNMTLSADPYAPLAGDPKILSPLDSAENVNAQAVVFKWSKVANASNYYLEYGRTSSISTPDAALVLTDTFYNAKLLEGKKYYWRVRASNFGYTCTAGVLKKGLFKTASPTNTKETLILQDFLVFPNPITTEQSVTVQFESDFSEKATVVIVDAQGKILIQQAQTIQTGQNIFDISLHSLPKGFYCLEIKTQRGSRMEKIVVF